MAGRSGAAITGTGSSVLRIWWRCRDGKQRCGVFSCCRRIRTVHPSTTVRLTWRGRRRPGGGHGRVYDVQGRLLRTLHDGRPGGLEQLVWTAGIAGRPRPAGFTSCGPAAGSRRRRQDELDQ